MEPTGGARVCPTCGATMEQGSVAAESYFGGAKWLKKRSLLVLGGERIGDFRWDGVVWFDGFRCPACRLLLLNY